MAKLATATPVGLGPWVKATTLGWLLGFVLVIVLAIAWDMVGGGAQFMVGVGMGAGVGVLQARVLGERIGPPKRWVLATTIGMGLPFVLWDLSAPLNLEGFFSLPVCVVIGGLLVGGLQSALLRARLRRTHWWVPASLVGWGLPVAAIVIADSGLLSGPGAVLSVGAMLLGGAVLGAVTGSVLLRLPQRQSIANR